MKSGSWRKYSVVVLKKSQMNERQIWQICPGEIPHCFVCGWELRRKPEWAKFLWGSKSEIQGKLLFSFSGIEVNGSKRLSPTPSMTNLSLRPCRYLSTVTRSSDRGSVDECLVFETTLQRFVTFDSLSVEASWRKITNGKENYLVLPRRNLEATGAIGANLRPFSFGGSVEPLRWSA